jgi:hypothetical protein
MDPRIRRLMDPKIRSLLYDQPRLYELVFPDETIGEMCRAAFDRYLSASPRRCWMSDAAPAGSSRG